MDPHDVEDPTSKNGEAAHHKREFVESSLLLALWSILVMNEGAIRFIASGQPGAPELFGGMPTRFPTAFLAALFEVIFGLFGLFVGLAGGILKYFNKSLQLALVVVQTLMGWYVFVVYVFLLPSYRITNEEPMLGLSVESSRTVGVLGILTSLAWCLALQGGQFVFISRMFAFGGNSDFLAQRKGAKMRAVFWNANYAIAGIWALISACIIINGTGGVWTTATPFFAPPNVGRFPILLLLTALLMTIWPLIGVGIVLSGKVQSIRAYTLCSFFVFLVVYANYTLVQFGFMSGNPAPPSDVANGAGFHNHLTMMLAFLGPYFMNKYAVEQMSLDEILEG